MSEEEINKAILTLDVLIDCTKEDGTYYNAKKEWEALEVFKKLQQENQQLKDRINKAVEYINDLYIDFYNYGCDKLIVGKYMVNDLLDLLKGDTNE